MVAESYLSPVSHLGLRQGFKHSVRHAFGWLPMGKILSVLRRHAHTTFQPKDQQRHIYRCENFASDIISVIKSRRMRLAGHVALMERYWIHKRNSGGKAWREGTTRTTYAREGDNIKTNINEVGLEVEWIYLVQDRIR